MVSYQFICIIHHIDCENKGSFYQMDNEHIIVSGYSIVSYINVKKWTTENLGNTSITLYSFCNIDNVNVIGGGDSSFYIYNVINKTYLRKPLHHYNIISGIIKIDDQTIASASYDKTIKIWKLIS